MDPRAALEILAQRQKAQHACPCHAPAMHVDAAASDLPHLPELGQLTVTTKPLVPVEVGFGSLSSLDLKPA